MIPSLCFKCDKPFIPLNIFQSICTACVKEEQMSKEVGFGQLPANPEDRPNLNKISSTHNEVVNIPMGVVVSQQPDGKWNKSESIANEKQYGGIHYKKMAIEPWDYIARNKIGYLDGSAIKYLSRWREKNGVEDLKKAIHFIEKLIEIENEKQSINTPNN